MNKKARKPDLKCSSLTVLLIAVAVFATLFFSVTPAISSEKPSPPPNASAFDHRGDDGTIIEVYWEESQSDGISEYRVYRSESAKGEFLHIGSTVTDLEIDYLRLFDTGLEPEKQYFYRVTAVNSDGIESEPSETASAVTEIEIVFDAASTVYKRIVISLAEQRLYCLENDRIVNVFRVSTGKPSTPTPTGRRHVQYHTQSMPIAQSPGTVCDYWMGIGGNYGIHAWPRSGGRYNNLGSLGTPVSNGCIRLHPQEAHWPYHWAPNGTPVDIIAGRFTTPTPPIEGAHNSIGSSSPATRWLFSEGCTQGEFRTYILVQNPNYEPAGINIRLLRDDGHVADVPVHMEEASRFTLDAGSVAGFESCSFSAEVTSSLPVVSERSMYFEYIGITDGHNTIGSRGPRFSWFMAEGYTGEGFTTYILIGNPSDRDANVSIRFMREDSREFSFNVTVRAYSRWTLRANDIPEIDNSSFMTSISSDVPIVAERAVYVNSATKAGGHCTIASNELSEEWYFAEGFCAPEQDSYLLMGNPNQNDVNAEIRLTREDGHSRILNYTVEKRSRSTLHINTLDDFANSAFSICISSSSPIVAERAVYFSRGPNFKGSYCSVGASEASVNWYLAEGYTANRFEEYVLVANTTGEEADVWLTFMIENGSPVGYGYQIQPYGRLTVHVDSLPGLAAASVSCIVYSDVPVVAERTMYFSISRE